MITGSNTRQLYDWALFIGWFGHLWATLRGRSRRLLDLTTVASTCAIGDRRAVGTQVVALRQIRGSEGRCADFDVDFHPRTTHTRERWLRVAQAYERGIALPLVELVRVGEIYFVRDGHHRISVAGALGQQEIDAVVTVWQVAQAMPAISPRPATLAPDPAASSVGSAPVLLSDLLVDS